MQQKEQLEKQQKKLLRVELLKKREQINPEVAKFKSRKICDHLSQWLTTDGEGVKVHWLGLFASHRGEPDLMALASCDRFEKSDQRAILTALPVVETFGLEVHKFPETTTQNTKTKQMDFYKYHLGDPTLTNRYGILEPLPSPSLKMPTDLCPGETLILVPALSVDLSGYRLGYGGGFYDRYLKQHPNVKALGVIFQEFMIEKLPQESHDRKLDGLVTENGLSFFK